MYKWLAVLVAFMGVTSVFAQSNTPDLTSGNYVIKNYESTDTVKQRYRSAYSLRQLKHGAVIVRLKTNQKSIDAYRKAGRDDVAQRMELNAFDQNQKLYSAFSNFFTFCKVYFIYANQTDSFLAGNKHVFLNEKLQPDTSIIFRDSFFVFCEYGSAEAYSNFHDLPNRHEPPPTILGAQPTETSSAPATTSGLFFMDENLQQFQRPFPFVEGVYLDRFDPTVRTLNNEMERAYNRLVVNQDIKQNTKEQRRKHREEMKKIKYDPLRNY